MTGQISWPELLIMIFGFIGFGLWLYIPYSDRKEKEFDEAMKGYFPDDDDPQ